MYLYQLDNSKIGIMLYSETYNKTKLESYLQHLQLVEMGLNGMTNQSYTAVKYFYLQGTSN